MSFEYYSNMTPMKYYQPTSYDSPNAKAMIENTNNNNIAMWKFDGEWCRIIKYNGKVIAQSRTISKVTGEYGNKTELIPHIIDEVVKHLPDGTVLIGELCWTDITKTSKDVGTILRCLPAKAVARQQKEKLVFRPFDCLSYGYDQLEERTFGERFSALLRLDFSRFNYILPPMYTCEKFPEFLQDILAMGGEGIVIHSCNYVYAPGKRPAWTTLKVKKITTELELPVVSFIEPNRTYEGTEIESWKFFIDGEPVTKPYFYGWKNGVVVDHMGTKVRVTSGMTDADREWLASEEAQTLLGSGSIYAVVSAMEVDKESGSLRHPRLIRLRTDV